MSRTSKMDRIGASAQRLHSRLPFVHEAGFRGDGEFHSIRHTDVARLRISSERSLDRQTPKQRDAAKDEIDIGQLIVIPIRVILRIIPFLVAIPCGLLAPFFVLTVPGNPATAAWEVAYWLALWASLILYPFAVFTLGVRLWGDRKAKRLPGLWRKLWIAFGLLVVVQGPIWVKFTLEEIHRAEVRANLPIEQKLQMTLWHGEPAETRALIEAGADVNMRLFNGGSAGQFAAEEGDWELVIWLMDRGADIDHADRFGHSLRSATTNAPEPTDPGNAAALATVRARIADQERR